MKIKNLFFLMTFASFTTLNVACSKDDDDKINDNKDNTEDVDDKDDGNNTSDYDCLKGSDYYLFAMDGTTEQKISSKVTLDCRTDESTIALYVWDDTYTAANATGPNYFGEVEGWTALTVGSVGWSGLGICVIPPANGGSRTVDLTKITKDHTFHIAMRSLDNTTHLISLVGGDGNQASVAIGDVAFVDNGKTFQPYTNFKRDGEWYSIEIPMSVFFDNGLVYRNQSQNDNLITFLSGGTAGRMLQFDAMFIYKK